MSQYKYDFNDDDDDDEGPAWDLTKSRRRFGGNPGEDAFSFLEDLELYIAAKQIPPEEVLGQLIFVLEGQAQKWWWNNPGDGEIIIKSWEDAKTALLKEFGKEKSLADLFSELRARHQQPNERAIDYITAISSIMRKMKPPLHDSLQVGFIISGLKPSIARHMIGKDKLGLLKLTAQIIRVEADLKLVSRKE